MGKDSKSELCSGCGGAYQTVENCSLKTHPDFSQGPDLLSLQEAVAILIGGCSHARGN